MKKFQCQNCNYKFERIQEPLICPYCGEKGTVRPTPTAEEILAEVSARDRVEKREETQQAA